METILKAKESIARLWGFPKPKASEYRLMKYLLKSEIEEGVLLHNTVTGHLIKLDQEEARLLDNLPARPTDQMQELIKYHFLVPEDFDEYKSVKQLRKVFQSHLIGDAINHYVILPTTFCNARCFYCYESDYPHVNMTEETANEIIKFIAEHRKDKTVKLNWFGGEPLLGIKRIDQISQGLKELDIPFFASMISNGYLLDEEIIQRSVTLWNLQYIQITLDGPEEAYNKVKAFSKVEDNPYQRVHRNIELLSKYKITVAIRLNLDLYNRHVIQELIEELGERYRGNQYVRAYLSLLYKERGFEPIHRSEEEYNELLQVYEDYTKRLLAIGIAQDRRRIPQLRAHQCMADNPHSIMIQPDGGFCRCEHENVEQSYGNLIEGIIDPQRPVQWTETIEKTDYCPGCSMYPFCYLLQNCMETGEPCNEFARKNFQKRHIEKLKSIYQNYQEEKKNEGI